MSSREPPNGRQGGESDDGPLDDEALAAQYVLGTLSLDRRRALEARLAGDAGLAAHVRYFEQALQPLAAIVPEATPSPDCDGRIAAAIRALAAESDAAAPVAAASTPIVRTVDIDVGSGTVLALNRSRSRWRAVALAASVAALALGAALSSALTGIGPLGRERAVEVTVAPVAPTPSVTPERTALSLLRDGEGRARYLVEIGDDDSVSITALDRADAPDAGSLQLWMADTESGELRSVGLLPRDDWSSVRVGDSPLVDAPAFAVSVEPPGGSPADGPTGDVVFEGSIHPVPDGFR